MKILHVASFQGNIGDNASHMGLASILDTLLPDYSIDRKEIRKFYKNYAGKDKLSFDRSFIDNANRYDVLIIGGGGFLDYWVPDSATGTTIDIHPELLSNLTVPTIFTSMGCNPHRDIPDGNIEKFRNFLDLLLSSENIKIALRNDGSVNTFKNQIGAHYLEAMDQILDNGYFFKPEGEQPLPIEKDYLAINITSDQIAMNSTMRGKIDASAYYANLASAFTTVIQEHGLHLVFIPHIYSDLQAISNVLSKMRDYLIRKDVTVAPCVQGNAGTHQLFSLYNKSKAVVGMRYHANVCSLAMGKRTVGLAALDRVRYTYDSFGLGDRYCGIDGEFQYELVAKIQLVLQQQGTDMQLCDHLAEEKRKSIECYTKIFSDLRLL